MNRARYLLIALRYGVQTANFLASKAVRMPKPEPEKKEPEAIATKMTRQMLEAGYLGLRIAIFLLPIVLVLTIL